MIAADHLPNPALTDEPGDILCGSCRAVVVLPGGAIGPPPPAVGWRGLSWLAEEAGLMHVRLTQRQATVTE